MKILFVGLITKEWTARLLIERSAAIKAPKIEYHLMCTKKFQQYLSEDGVLEKVFTDKNIVDAIRATFFNQYSFGTVYHLTCSLFTFLNIK